MGNRSGVCGGGPAQHCVDECTRLQYELEGRSRDAEDLDCDPAGAVFQDTLRGLSQLDKEAMLFASGSNLAAVRWLLAMGASVKCSDANGTTLLHTACRSGSISVVQELLRHGMPLDATDSVGWTPLHIAAVMGRREISLLLLQGRANPTVRNNRNALPADVCSDPGTSEVLRHFITKHFDRQTNSAVGSGHQQLSTIAAGTYDESLPTCEPFFVPRVPLFHDEPHAQELTYLGVELFNQSPGHGLAFFVATGVVHDHPSDVSTFLAQQNVNVERLSSFLGEDFSLAQTLRLAYIHSMDLSGTGVVQALEKAFRNLRVPPELQKLDRLTSGIAHLWWRIHDLEDCDTGVDVVDCSYLIQDKNGPSEPCGSELRRCIASGEGLRRLMFSTVMLCWNVRAVSPVIPSDHLRKITFANWLEINAGIEADGSNIPNSIQKCIYDKISRLTHSLLLPTPSQPKGSDASAGGHQKRPVGDKGLSNGPKLVDMDLAIEDEADPNTIDNALKMQDAAFVMRGWSSIPPGGLERQENLLHAAARSGPTFSHCILSEAQGIPMEGVKAPGSSEGEGEMVYLTLRFSLVLFLSTSPNEAPYAFIRMQDANIQEIRQKDRQIVLCGQLKYMNTDSVKGGTASSNTSPLAKAFGADGGRLPLTLCFLLADGRFHPFEALWLELQFKTSEEVAIWARELGVACDAGLKKQPPGSASATSSVDVPGRRLGPESGAAAKRLRGLRPVADEQEDEGAALPDAVAATKKASNPRPAG